MKKLNRFSNQLSYFLLSSRRFCSFLAAGVTLIVLIASDKAIIAASGLPDTNVQNIDQLAEKLCGALDTAFSIFIVLAIALVLYAAFLYLTAGGSPEQVNKATKTLTFAAVAILVAILAKGFPKLIGSILGVTTGIGGC